MRTASPGRRELLRGVYFVTEEYGPGHLELCRRALEGGVRIVQFRDKTMSKDVFVDVGRKMREICAAYGALLIVNDRVEEAVAIGADGVHVGQDDMPIRDARALLGDEAIVGLSIASVEQARAGELAGADYVAVSPVFDTATKEDAGAGLGVGLVRDVRQAVGIPVAAIGGLNATNLSAVVEAGADMVAVVSAISRAHDPGAAARALVAAFEEAWKARNRR